MTALQQFFHLNRILVFFVYGQVFFVMGLAVALQSRRHSRLQLARSLGWLAFFGLAHGLHEWGAIFIPIQATYINVSALRVLQVMHVVLLALSFAALFQFGAELVQEQWPRLLMAPLIVTLLWTLWFVLPGPALAHQFEDWKLSASIWARYLIGFPGGLLAAYGIRVQAERIIKPLNLMGIYRTLQVAGMAMLAYSILGGLVVPYANLFPANWLNEGQVVAWVGIPVPIFRSLAGLVMALSIIRALDVFDVEVDRLIEQMELEQSLMAEREHIGRELHDGALQQIYSAGLMMEAAKGKITQEPAIASRRLEQAMSAQNEAIASLRAYMGQLRPAPATISLVDGLRQQTADPRLSSLMQVELKLDLPETAYFTPTQTSHILSVVSEALSNAARHAQARHLTIHAHLRPPHCLITVRDDGRGFAGQPATGYGLHNMHDRAHLLGGTLTISSQLGQGTTIALLVPLETTP